MKSSNYIQEINKKSIKAIHSELMMRRDKLIKITYDQNIQMDQLDRDCIRSFFENKAIPNPPRNIPELTKTFFTSCFSYAPLRKHLSSILGSIPTPSTLPQCLNEIYFEEDFLANDNWTPIKLYNIAEKIQQKEKYNLKSNEFKPRMISVILNGTQEMDKRLKFGIENFYQKLEYINKISGAEMWEYIIGFQKNIYNVGPALICDFLKNIGCDRFVKVDHHFKKEFPSLLKFNHCMRLTAKEHFILSQKISNLLKMSPFHLDHLLYQWGRYKKYQPTKEHKKAPII